MTYLINAHVGSGLTLIQWQILLVSLNWFIVLSAITNISSLLVAVPTLLYHEFIYSTDTLSVNISRLNYT